MSRGKETAQATEAMNSPAGSWRSSRSSSRLRACWGKPPGFCCLAAAGSDLDRQKSHLRVARAQWCDLRVAYRRLESPTQLATSFRAVGITIDRLGSLLDRLDRRFATILREDAELAALLAELSAIAPDPQKGSLPQSRLGHRRSRRRLLRRRPLIGGGARDMADYSIWVLEYAASPETEMGSIVYGAHNQGARPMALCLCRAAIARPRAMVDVGYTPRRFRRGSGLALRRRTLARAPRSLGALRSETRDVDTVFITHVLSTISATWKPFQTRGSMWPSGRSRNPSGRCHCPSG